ncbi:MAG: WhiB family transcriptional regulator [Actinomycetes bacterium]
MDRNRPLPIPKDPSLVAVTVDSGEWRVRAACRGADLSVFYSPDGERRGARDRREAQARQICQVCPVLVRCRDHALTVGESYGVWGGMTESDRRKHTHRARRGERRPRRSVMSDLLALHRGYAGPHSPGRPTVHIPAERREVAPPAGDSHADLDRADSHRRILRRGME